MKIPYRDEEIKGGMKRTYWPRGDAADKRRTMRAKMESELAKKGKKYSVSDKKKALDERWGQYCEIQRSLEERNG
jgi:hypothetical protein